MTEEEKKAIECLKGRLEILHNNTQWATENSIKVVLNLIDKQQKEIEKLKQTIIIDENVITSLEKDLFEGGSNYIVSKDKIRNKIKNLEKSKEFNEVITIKFRQHGFENGVNIKFLIDIMIDILKSLLQE